MYRFFLVLCFCSLINATYAQEFQPGQSYFDSLEYVEYIHGTIPLILSVPHGGEKKPPTIEDRDCTGCVLINDAFTQELARSMTFYIHELTGCYPHVVFNRLHRSKLDANREVQEAADGNVSAEEAWDSYQKFVMRAEDFVSKNYDRGLFLDLHGHGHEIQRLELGYLLSKNDLQLEDESLDLKIDKCSIGNLVEENNYTLSELVRGDLAFGKLVDEQAYRAVPSIEEPFPEDEESYFSGGFNTVQYGSRSSDVLDAIQIECHQDVRFDGVERDKFAKSIAEAIVEFLQLHYSDNFEGFNCTAVNTHDLEDTVISLSPNPASETFEICASRKINHVSIFSQYGSLISEFSIEEDSCKTINVSSWNEGIYYLSYSQSETHRVKQLVVIR